jgi:hypothetical protein
MNAIGRSIAGCGLVLLPATAIAQTCTTPNSTPASCLPASLATPATMINPRTIRLTLSTISTAATPAIADFDNTFVALTGPVATVNANRPWTLLISAAAATWTNTGVGSRANKPAADLTWSTAAAGVFTALTTTAVQVATGAPTNATVTSLFYRGTLSWALDAPGVYTLGVTITATTP